MWSKMVRKKSKNSFVANGVWDVMNPSLISNFSNRSVKEIFQSNLLILYGRKDQHSNETQKCN